MANADRHFRIAQLLASTNEYGNAVAHIILGSEERVKAIFLFLEGKGMQLRSIKGVKNIFSTHDARHSLIKEFFSVWLVIRPVIHRLEGNQTSEIKLRPEFKSSKFLDGLLTAVQIGYGLYNGYMNYQWWDKADALKQQGFYVDYAGKPVAPDFITKADYDHAYQQATSLQSELQEFIQKLEDCSIEEMKEFQTLFTQANFKEQIEESLKRGSRTKKEKRSIN